MKFELRLYNKINYVPIWRINLV